MAGHGDGPTFATIDTDVLIEFIRVDRIDLLGRNPAYQFILPDAVYEEVTEPTQRRRLDRAIKRDHFRRAELSQLSALEIYQELRKRLDKGESACIALSEINGWHVASDEKGAFEAIADTRLGPGRIITSADILLGCVLDGHLAVRDADGLKDAFKNAYTFETFEDYLP